MSSPLHKDMLMWEYEKTFNCTAVMLIQCFFSINVPINGDPDIEFNYRRQNYCFSFSWTSNSLAAAALPGDMHLMRMIVTM